MRTPLFTLMLLAACLTFAPFASAREVIWIEGEDCPSETYNQHSWYCSTNMDIYAAWEMAATGPSNANEMQRMGDYIRFLADTQRGFFEQRGSRLRTLGFQGVFVTTAWQVGGPAANAANLYCDDAGGAIDRHSYAGGGDGGHGIVAGSVNNYTHLASPGSYLLHEAFQQIEDKPFTVSE